jgi:hypothetical protein
VEVANIDPVRGHADLRREEPHMPPEPLAPLRGIPRDEMCIRPVALIAPEQETATLDP